MFHNTFGSSYTKRRELELRESYGGAISIQDIFDYVDIAIAEALNQQNVNIKAEVDKASLAAAEKAITQMLDAIH